MKNNHKWGIIASVGMVLMLLGVGLLVFLNNVVILAVFGISGFLMFNIGVIKGYLIL
jgi:hypothetical protein